MEKYISIDIGGTAIKYGIINQKGIIEKRLEKETEAYQGGSAIVDKVIRIVEELQPGEKICGIGISTAGMVDAKRGEIIYSGPQIPDYKGTKWKNILEGKFGIPCEVENDVNCAGLAESISGAASGYKNMVCLTVGTGIGGCIVSDGKIYHGHGNSACEVGYMILENGDLQTLASASALTAKVAKAKGMPAEQWDGRRIFQAAKEQDEICQRAIDEMVDALGRGIANICYIVNPEIVVLGGGIMAQKDYLYPRLRASLDRYLIPQIAKSTELKMAVHKNDAGMLGAFYNFQIRHGNRIGMEL